MFFCLPTPKIHDFIPEKTPFLPSVYFFSAGLERCPLPQWIEAAADSKFWGVCCMFSVDFWPTGKKFSFEFLYKKRVINSDQGAITFWSVLYAYKVCFVPTNKIKVCIFNTYRKFPPLPPPPRTVCLLIRKTLTGFLEEGGGVPGFQKDFFKQLKCTTNQYSTKIWVLI